MQAKRLKYNKKEIFTQNWNFLKNSNNNNNKKERKMCRPKTHVFIGPPIMIPGASQRFGYGGGYGGYGGGYGGGYY